MIASAGAENRVSSSRLVDMANALDVTVSYFSEEMSAGSAQTPGELMRTKQRPDNDEVKDPFAKHEKWNKINRANGCN